MHLWNMKPSSIQQKHEISYLNMQTPLQKQGTLRQMEGMLDAAIFAQFLYKSHSVRRKKIS